MDGEWLTYIDAGRKLGISTAAARQLSRHRGWQRRTPNAFGARAEILVPSEALERPIKPNTDPVRTAHDQPNTDGLQTAYELAVATLAAQLDRQNHRVDVLEVELADAKSLA
jgi:hypothetical protein